MLSAAAVWLGDGAAGQPLQGSVRGWDLNTSGCVSALPHPCDEEQRSCLSLELEEKTIATLTVVLPEQYPWCRASLRGLGEPVLPCRARLLSLGCPLARLHACNTALRRIRGRSGVNSAGVLLVTPCVSCLDFAYWHNFLYLFTSTG